MKLLQTILVGAAVLVPLTTIGADEYRVLDNNQTSNLRIAAKIGSNDGHPRLLVPAIIYQESKAGDDKKHSSFIGIGQLTLIAIKEVLQEHPDVSVECEGASAKTNPLKLKKTVQNNDRCGISVTSKYLKVLKEKYGIKTVEQQVVAYQLGPNAAKKLTSSPYSKSVMRHKAKLGPIME